VFESSPYPANQIPLVHAEQAAEQMPRHATVSDAGQVADLLPRLFR